MAELTRAEKIAKAKAAMNSRLDNLILNVRNHRRGLVGAQDAHEIGLENLYFLVFYSYNLTRAYQSRD